MEQIKVNTARIAAVRAQLSETLAGLRQENGRLLDALAALKAMWSGESEEAWEERLRLDLAEWEEALRGLAELAEYEAVAIREYESCEAEIADWIHGMGGAE